MKHERLFRFTKSYMEHCMVNGIEKSGVKRIRLHDLRHSHASMLVDMGVAPLEIAERLGHEKVETTLNTYSHLYPSTQSKLAGLLDKKYKNNAIFHNLFQVRNIFYFYGNPHCFNGGLCVLIKSMTTP